MLTSPHVRANRERSIVHYFLCSHSGTTTTLSVSLKATGARTDSSSIFLCLMLNKLSLSLLTGWSAANLNKGHANWLNEYVASPRRCEIKRTHNIQLSLYWTTDFGSRWWLSEVTVSASTILTIISKTQYMLPALPERHHVRWNGTQLKFSALKWKRQHFSSLMYEEMNYCWYSLSPFSYDCTF